MNENIDLAKILNGCPKGTKFYSSVYGVVEFAEIDYINEPTHPIRIKTELGGYCQIANDGRALNAYKGECTFFPSKDQRDWARFERFWDKKPLDKPKTEKFDPKTLQPWDKILVRKVHSPHNISPWSCENFSYINPNTPQLVNGIASRYEICIPYNDETKHLRGTTDDCPEYYKWWKVDTGFWWEEYL